MGLRVRLKARRRHLQTAPSGPDRAEALKRYGMILADEGSPWFIYGTPDPRWNDNALSTLGRLRGQDFEAVDTRSLPRP